MKHLGIDYGTKRIGLALSDDTGSLAFPHAVIPAGQGALSAIDEIVKKEGVGRIVVGESRDLSGKANPVMEDIAQFKKDLEDLSGLPVEYEREFFTSALAARQFKDHTQPRRRANMRGSGSRPERRGKNPSHDTLDASAAALILQGYLDKHKH